MRWLVVLMGALWAVWWSAPEVYGPYRVTPFQRVLLNRCELLYTFPCGYHKCGLEFNRAP